jgi:hypothetical protein
MRSFIIHYLIFLLSENEKLLTVPKINWRIFFDCHKEIQQVDK